jgi:Zn-dependent protease with chaperone function
VLTIPFVLLVLAILVTLTSVICHMALPSILRALELVGPELRSQLLLFVAAAPWLLGASVLVSSLGDILFGACDFGSACLWNEDPTIIRPVSILFAVPLFCATAVLGILAFRQRVKSRRVLAAFNRASAPADEGATRIVPSAAALAFAGNGQVYVSTALRERLPPDQYRAVILHEEAHLRRRDGFSLSAAGILAGSYIAPFRRRLLSALALANEQSCDEYAASFVGPNAVAAAILAVERLSAGAERPAPRPGFADGFVAARIRRLLKTEAPRANFALVRTGVVLAIMFAFLTGDVLYYLAMLILYPGI